MPEEITSTRSNTIGGNPVHDALLEINSDLDLDTAIRNVLGILLKLFNAEMANVVLLDQRIYSLKAYSLVNGPDTHVRALSPSCTEDLIGWREANRKAIIANDLADDSKFNAIIKACHEISPRSLIGVPLFAEGEFFGMVQAINSANTDGFTEDEFSFLGDLAPHLALTLRNAWILQEAKRGSREAKSLYEIGIALSKALDLDELLEKVLDNLLRVITCNSAVIYLINPHSGTINQVVGRGLQDSTKEKLRLKVGQGITGRVAQTGKGIIVSDVASNPDYIAFRPETRSEMAVPIRSGDDIIGAFNIESDLPNAYNQHDLQMLEAFASLAAITIERARLYAERMAARKISDELSIARRIQMTFLPAQDPQISGFDISGLNIPSAAVGGDYYDFIPIVDNQLGVAIGDVSGKGIPASLIMAAFRASLKAEIRNNFAIRAILFKVNNLLFESIERDNYVTAIYCVLDSKNRILTFSNAGHNPPILRHSNGQVEYLKEGGLALGMFANSNYEERPISLSKGDILLYYTDGVTEAKNDTEEEFGLERLLACLEESKDKSAKDTIEFIVRSTKKFASSRFEMDDLTLIVVKAL